MTRLKHTIFEEPLRDELRGAGLKGLLRLTLHAIVRSRTREQLLQGVCRAAVDQCGFAMSWVGWGDTETKIIVPIAQWGDNAEYLSAAQLYTDERPEGCGPAGQAYRSGQVTVCNDFRGDPSSLLWQQRARQHGYLAVAVVPLRLQYSVCGILVLYSAQSGYFQGADVQLLEELGAAISFTLDIFARESRHLETVAIANRFFTVAESSLDAIVSYSLDGTITGWNPAAEKMFGYSSAEILGLNASILMPPDRQLEPEDIFARIARAETIVDVEAVRLRKNAQTLKVLLSVAPVRSGAGTVVGAVQILRDATDREIAQEHLRTFQTQFDLVFQNLDEGLLISDTEGNLLAWNPSAAAMHGIEGRKRFPRPYQELADFFEVATLDGVALPMDQRPLARVLRGEQVTDLEVRVRREESDPPRIFCYSGSAIYHTSSRGLGFITVKDVSERHLAQESLQNSAAHLEHRVRERTAELATAKERAETSDRLKSVFLTTMSHELRTPLNAILGFCSLLLQQVSGPINTEQASQLELVKSSAHHLLDLINDVLDMSQIEAGQMQVFAEPYDLISSIEKVLATIKPLADKKRLTLLVDLKHCAAHIVSDQRRVEQVLLNLLANAVKFTDAGEITLSGDIIRAPERSHEESRRSYVRLRVADTGIGISAKDIAKLFRPFHQVESAVRQRDGSGLGLAICRRLADLLGGDVSVESQLGQGSVFTFTLPLNQIHAIQ